MISPIVCAIALSVIRQQHNIRLFIPKRWGPIEFTPKMPNCYIAVLCTRLEQVKAEIDTFSFPLLLVLLQNMKKILI